MYELLKKNISRHVKLEPEEFDQFRKKLIVKTYEKYSHLLQVGQICRYTFFVNSGVLRLYDINEKGYEKNTLFAVEEWWVSDLYSYHRQKPGTYFLQALENTEVFQLAKNDLENLLIAIPKLERFRRILHLGVKLP